MLFLKTFKDAKIVVDGNAFQTFITLSTKKFCLMLQLSYQKFLMRPILTEPRPQVHYNSQPNAETPRKHKSNEMLRKSKSMACQLTYDADVFMHVPQPVSDSLNVFYGCDLSPNADDFTSIQTSNDRYLDFTVLRFPATVNQIGLCISLSTESTPQRL